MASGIYKRAAPGSVQSHAGNGTVVDRISVSGCRSRPVDTKEVTTMTVGSRNAGSSRAEGTALPRHVAFRGPAPVIKGHNDNVACNLLTSMMSIYGEVTCVL